MSDMSGQGGPYRSAGWYHAQGDPPGTQRYWDGTTWHGEPQPVNPRAATGTGAESVYGTQSADPRVHEAETQQPTGYETQAYQTQAYEAPSYEAPSYETRAYDASTSEAPIHETSGYDASSQETAAPGSSSGGDGVSAGGFLQALFDTKFEHFVTRRAMSLVYILALVAVGLFTLFFLLTGLAAGGLQALIALIMAPLIGLLYLIWIRMMLEFFVNQFRQSELLEEISAKLDRD